MKKFIEISFISLFCLLATAFYQKEGEEQVISVNADGWASKTRVLSEDELKEIDFTRISEIGYYIIDQFTSMRLFGATVYIDGDVFKDTQHLYVVNPLSYKGRILAMDAQSFTYLMEGQHYLALISGAEDYIQINYSDKPLFQYNRLIDPHECSNASAPANSPHHTGHSGQDSSPCHGDDGNLGGCSGENSNVEYSVQCFQIEAGNGEIRAYCIARVSCEDGFEGSLPPNTEGEIITVPQISCRSAGNCCTSLAGNEGSDVGVVDCGSGSLTLNCAR